MKKPKRTLRILSLLFAVVSATASSAITIDPPTRNFAKEGGGAAILVTAGPAESWTATTASSWINITPTTSGTGNGTVAYLVSANFSADVRTDTILIGGQTHTVTQTGYPSTINPTFALFNLMGGSGAIDVTVQAGISWSAVCDQSWVQITSGATGFGSGAVTFTVAANTDIATRFANISLAGQVFTISQSGTDVIVTPRTATVGPDTSIVQLNIRALATTSWAVVPGAEWIFPIGASTGSGDGSVNLGVAQNVSWAQRVGTVQIGSVLVTIAQAGVENPVYAITPTSVTAPAAGAAGAIAVSATMDAPWNAAGSMPWLAIVSGTTGAGNGGIQYVVSQNPFITNRTGTVTVQGSAPQAFPDLLRAQMAHLPFNGGVGNYMPFSPVLNSGGQFTPARPGNPDGQALYFNNAYTLFTEFNSVWARTQPDTTYAFWFKVDWDNRINRLLRLEGGAEVAIYTEADGRLRCDGPAGSLYPAQYIKAQQWYHLILRQTAIGVDLWLNGQVVASAPWTNQLPIANNRPRLGGGGGWGANNFYQGAIDEFRFWDRGLTDQEINLLYSEEVAGTSTRLYNAYVATPTPLRSDKRLAFFRFEQSALDADQFGRYWLPHNFQGWTTDRFGREKSAISITHVNGNVQIPREDQFHTSNAATHVFWVKFNSLQAQTVFMKEWRNIPDGWLRRFCLRVRDGNNLTMVNRRQSGPTTVDEGSLNVEIGLAVDQWYQFCLAATNEVVSLYIDGILYSTGAFGSFRWGKIANGDDPGYGASYLGVNYEVRAANASFDDYQIYDRALTSEEVFAKYNAERPKLLTHTVTQAASVGELSASSTNFPAGGGSGALQLTIGSAAVWTVSSDSAWLSIVGSTNGTGNGTINYTVAANGTITNRTGKLTIAGIPYLVHQAGRGVTVDAAAFAFGPDGGLGQFSVASENNAAWAVVNTNAWITPASGGSGTAPAVCQLIVSPYASPLVERAGFLTLGTNVIVVSQSGYTASVSPLVNVAAANGGSQSVTVTVPPGALWSAIAQVPWITIIGGQSQSGSGALTYIIAGNAGGSRSGTIVVAGQLVTVNQNAATAGSVVQLNVGSATTRYGEQVVIPITAIGFSNIQSAQFSFKWDYTKLQYVGVEQYGLPGLSAANFGFPSAGTLTFSWEHPTLDFTNLPTNTPLYAVRFIANALAGTSTQLRVDSIPTVIELMDPNGIRKVVTTTQGGVSVISTFDISGQTRYQDTAFPVTNVNFAASGGLAQVVNSGTGNSYLFSVSNSANVTIAATKLGDGNPSAGVSVADIVLVRRHVLALSTLNSPYKLIAADANGSGTITTADITAMRRLILGLTNGLPVGLWRMVPSDHIFSDPHVPWYAPNYRQYFSVLGSYGAQNFAGIKIGDVDGSWTNTLVSSQGTVEQGSDSSDGPVIMNGDATTLSLSVSSATVPAGGTVSVNILATNFSDIRGLQFTFEWDPQLFAYVGLANINLSSFGSGNIGTAFTSAGKLTVVWDDLGGIGVSLVDGTSLFEIVLQSTGTAGVSPAGFSDVPTAREVVTASTTAIPLTVSGTLVVEPGGLLIDSASIAQTGAFVLEFDHLQGRVYEVFYSTNLVQWQLVPGVSFTFPSTGRARWTDDGGQTGGMGSLKFYRLRMQ